MSALIVIQRMIFFNFAENRSDTNVNIKLLVNDYNMSNGNLKSPLEMPTILKEMYIKCNTAVPSAHVERLLFSAGLLEVSC